MSIPLLSIIYTLYQQLSICLYVTEAHGLFYRLLYLQINIKTQDVIPEFQICNVKNSFKMTIKCLYTSLQYSETNF